MKRIFSFILTLIMLASSVLLFSCNGGKARLKKYDGWWTRPDGYSSAEEDGFMSDNIRIIAEETSVVCYSEYGLAGEKYSCTAEGGELLVDMDGAKVQRFVLVDDTLVNKNSGAVEYVRGEPIEQVNVGLFYGKWYRSGDVFSDCCVLSEDEYEFFSTSVHIGAADHVGEWSIEGGIRYTADGTEHEEMLIRLKRSIGEVETFSEYSLQCGGYVLYENSSREFFLHEKAFENGTADRCIAEMRLITEEWTADGNEDMYITFDIYSSSVCLNVKKTQEDGSEAYTAETVGSYAYDGSRLYITYKTGAKEEIALTKDTASITLLSIPDAKGVTFVRDVW